MSRRNLDSQVQRYVEMQPEEDQLSEAMHILSIVGAYLQRNTYVWDPKYELTYQAQLVLNALISSPNIPVTYEKFDLVLNHLNGRSSQDAIKVHICRIRKSLGLSKSKGTDFIKTIWGVGYMFNPSIGDFKQYLDPAHLRGVSWTDSEDLDLIRMWAAGSNWNFIIEELNKSEADCRDRINQLLA